MVDTLGLIITVIVHAANFADSTSASMVVAYAHLNQPTLEHIWADQGYRGDTLPPVADGCAVEFEVVERTEPGFAVLPKPWVVERNACLVG